MYNGGREQINNCGIFVYLKLKVKSEKLWKDPSAAPQDDNITPVILREQ